MAKMKSALSPIGMGHKGGMNQKGTISGVGAVAKQVTKPERAMGKVSASKILKSQPGTGHIEGASMRGNMMGYKSSKMPFDGHHPKDGKVNSVSIGELKSSNAHAPGAMRQEGKVHSNLVKGIPMPAGWSGASGSHGGASGKTVGMKMKKGQS